MTSRNALFFLPEMLVAILFCLAILFVAGCSGKTLEVPPYVPPQYLGAIETDQYSIVDMYTLNYDRWTAKQTFDNKYVVLKNVKIAEYELAAKQKGYLIVNSIKCEPADPACLDSLYTGMRVDIVGLCQGIVKENGYEVIKFIDVLILPAGAVELSAGGETVSSEY